MKDYVLRSVDCYSLPREVYYQCVWLIKDMERLESLKDNASNIGLGLAANKRLEAINMALEEIPEEYRESILKNIIDKEDYPEIAHRNTWRKWKQRFMYELAINLELV